MQRALYWAGLKDPNHKELYGSDVPLTQMAIWYRDIVNRWLACDRLIYVQNGVRRRPILMIPVRCILIFTTITRFRVRINNFPCAISTMYGDHVNDLPVSTNTFGSDNFNSPGGIIGQYRRQTARLIFICKRIFAGRDDRGWTEFISSCIWLWFWMETDLIGNYGYYFKQKSQCRLTLYREYWNKRAAVFLTIFARLWRFVRRDSTLPYPPLAHTLDGDGDLDFASAHQQGRCTGLKNNAGPSNPL